MPVCAILNLDEIEGRSPPPKFPIVLGHQIIGNVDQTGKNARRFKKGDRVGIAWIHSACGKCVACVSGNENLCEDFKATGRDIDGRIRRIYNCFGGFFLQNTGAVLRCTGSTSFVCRCHWLSFFTARRNKRWRLSGVDRFWGHRLIWCLKMVRYQYPNSRVFVFARSKKERDFAKELGAGLGR